ncbi:hypothetical protein ACLOJK_035282 [Asimina triloba]
MKPPSSYGFIFIVLHGATIDLICVSSFNCDSCKSGILANLKKNWRKVAIVNVSTLIFLVISYSIGCCALKNNGADNRYEGHRIAGLLSGKIACVSHEIYLRFYAPLDPAGFVSAVDRKGAVCKISEPKIEKPKGEERLRPRFAIAHFRLLRPHRLSPSPDRPAPLSLPLHLPRPALARLLPLPSPLSASSLAPSLCLARSQPALSPLPSASPALPISSRISRPDHLRRRLLLVLQFKAMLLSPGHSPRHISETSPEISSSAPNRSPRNPRKRPASTVLDEDTYVAAIEKIVERDFFPDLHKLRDRVDWLEAVRSGDPIQIRDAQLKILERRGGGGGAVTPASSHGKIGSTFFSSPTPFDLDKTPAFRSAGELSLAASSGEPADDSVAVVDDSLSLDQFFRRYTSEDNESFSKILGKENTKRRERFGYLRDGGKEQVRSLETEKRDRVTDGYGTSGQPLSTLEGWKYTAKNLLMYNPSDQGEAPLTEAERAERIKSLTKEIDRSNTQFHGKFTDVRPREEDPVAILYTPVAGTTPANGAAWPFSGRDAERSKKYDLEDLRKTPNPFYVESTKKSEDGYSFVRTPSPAPGVDESPFITWGEIEGTPLRLEADEMLGGIGNGGDGPHFRIPLAPSRDVKAHELSRDAARKLRESSKMFQKPPLPSPARGGSMSPNVRTLSSAAQKFVRNAISKSSSSVDESLRASYRGASPCIGTPKAGRSSLTRFGLGGSLGSRSPSVRDCSNPPL